MSKKLIQHYETGHVEELIDTQYGIVTYEEFILSEAERIGRQPGREAYPEYEGDQIWLMVNDVSEKVIYKTSGDITE